ncbi:MAG: HipA domain-containing protein [Ferrovibrio sp.]|nr:HipA domain-containing protein [Ferrovibrio sp.]
MNGDLLLDVWLEAYLEPVGQLFRPRESIGCYFQYSPAHLQRRYAMPLSLSLPLREAPYDDPETRAYFDNLLPENDQMQQVMAREGISRDDIVGLMLHFGADCAGAVSCLPHGAAPVKIPGSLADDYDALDDADLTELMRRLAAREPLPAGMGDPSPVAGVQSKIALTEIVPGRYGLPKNAFKVPTTHILKVPRQNEVRDARLEVAATRLAAAVGLPVALPALFELGGQTGLLSQRFDRRVRDGKVYRLHQEDFCQALGLPALLKYQRRGGAGRAFSLAAVNGLLGRTDAPARNRRLFVLATIFNLAIGNNDNHAKNHALLYDRSPVPTLAPLYDLLPVRLAGRYTDELAFTIGAAERFGDVTRADLAALFAAFGWNKAKAVDRLIQDEIAPLLQTLDEAASGLTRLHLKDLDDFLGREITHLAQQLGLNLVLRPRDYAAPRAGGWGGGIS